MIEYVVKRDGSTEKFDPVKLNKWAEYATAVGGNWSEIAQKTFKRLQNYCKTTDIQFYRMKFKCLPIVIVLEM